MFLLEVFEGGTTTLFKSTSFYFMGETLRELLRWGYIDKKSHFYKTSYMQLAYQTLSSPHQFS